MAVIMLFVAPATAQERSLDATKTVERQIYRAEIQSYQVVLKKGQFLKVVARQKDVDIKLSLYGLHSELLVQVDASNYAIDEIFDMSPVTVTASASEEETLSFESQQSGHYRLDVLPARSDTQPGGYTLKIEVGPAATNQDRKRIEAQTAFIEAEKLRKQRSAELLKRALEKYSEALGLWRITNDAIGQSHALDKLALTNLDLNQKNKAIEWLEQSLQLWRESSSRREVAHLFGSIAQIYTLQRDSKALVFADQALSLWQAEEDKKLELIAHLRCGYAHSLLLRNVQIASVHFDEAMKLARAIGDKRLEASLLIALRLGYSHSQEKRSALQNLQQALHLCREADHPTCEARTLVAFGDEYQFLGERQKALDFYDQALQLSRKWADGLNEIFALIHTGELYFYQSNYQKAIEYYTQGLNASQVSNNHWGEGYSLYNLGRVHELLGEKEKAVEYYEQSMPHWHVIGDYDGAAYTMNQIALILEARGQNERALKLLNDALELMRYIKDSYGEARTLDNIGSVYAGQRNPQRALELFNQALPLRTFLQDGAGEARTLGNIGIVYTDLGENDKALNYLNQATQRYQSIGNRAGEAEMHYRLALLKRNQGDEKAARAEIEATVSIVESLRAGVFNRNLRDSYFASIQSYYEFQIDLLMSQHKKQPAESFERVALNTVERARARGMLELLTESRADIRQGVDQALLDRELLLRQQLDEKEQSRMRLIGDRPDPLRIQVAEKEISDLASQYEQIESQIKARSPRYAAFTQPQPLAVEQIQNRLLDPETLLLEYSLGEQHSFLWAVTQTSVSSYELPKRSEIDRVVRKLYDLMVARQTKPGESQTRYFDRVQEADAQLEAQAATLTEMLLGPVASLLGTKRLLVIPDGSLAYVSFAALPNPSASKCGSRLVACHEFAYLPSASTLAVLRQEVEHRPTPPAAVAVFADPVFDKADDRIRRGSGALKTNQPSENAKIAKQALRDAGFLEEGSPLGRLPFSRQEAEWISALTPPSDTLKALGFKANLATVTSGELSRYRILHFATHGLVNPKRPYLSGLLLSLVDEQGKPQDGFLSLNQIYNLNLPADLVFLSACQTAMGKEVKGEGIVGLTRAFMYAGTPRVIASLWKVDDAATAEMVKLFYEAMLKQKRRPSAALQLAQLRMSKHQLWNSPYYWAGFILQGEPN